MWKFDLRVFSQNCYNEFIKTLLKSLGNVNGQPLCEVNVHDLYDDKDASFRCVGATDFLFIDNQLRKFCERTVESVSIYCPCKYSK